MLFTGLFRPLRLRGQHQTELPPGTVRHAGDFPGQVTGGLTPVRQRPPEAVRHPGKHPVRRQRRWQYVLSTRHPL